MAWVIGGKKFGQYTFEHWFDHEYEENFLDKIILRLEEEKDYRIVEEITREAFWDTHYPGCDEHLLIHNLRKTNEFVKELDYVAKYEDTVIGNIVYVKTKVKDKEKEHDVLTFGPVSVLPGLQNKGIGKKLINYTICLAEVMGYKAIIIYGDPEYYKKFGFNQSKKYNITDKEGRFPAALLVKELYPDALNGINGIFDEGKAYEVNINELEEFEKMFIKKEKGYKITQDRFNELSNQFL
ncbi:MAG: N-acetyltransferase [Treponema sp.]|nr:N-acetyltransferase [Treponema sp.]